MRNTKQIFQKAVTDAFLKQPNIKLNSDTMSDAVKYQKDMTEEDKIESTEATTSASSGAYSAPLFTKEETKENKLKGGLSDGMSLMDIAKKYTKDKTAKTQSPERIKKMYDHLSKQVLKGIQVEKEHTKDSDMAREIVMDHLAEDPNYYIKLRKIEESKEEAKEATTTASSGAYSTPAFIAKGSKNWRGGQKPIYKGGKFVKIKKKCLTFPYCNQGVGAIDLSEINNKKHILEKVSQRLGLSESTILGILKKIQDKKNNQ